MPESMGRKTLRRLNSGFMHECRFFGYNLYKQNNEEFEEIDIGSGCLNYFA